MDQLIKNKRHIRANLQLSLSCLVLALTTGCTVNTNTTPVQISTLASELKDNDLIVGHLNGKIYIVSSKSIELLNDTGSEFIISPNKQLLAYWKVSKTATHVNLFNMGNKKIYSYKITDYDTEHALKRLVFDKDSKNLHVSLSGQKPLELNINITTKSTNKQDDYILASYYNGYIYYRVSESMVYQVIGTKTAKKRNLNFETNNYIFRPTSMNDKGFLGLTYGNKKAQKLEIRNFNNEVLSEELLDDIYLCDGSAPNGQYVSISKSNIVKIYKVKDRIELIKEFNIKGKDKPVWLNDEVLALSTESLTTLYNVSNNKEVQIKDIEIFTAARTGNYSVVITE